MSNEVITCGVCQESYPKELFVSCNNGRVVCVKCADSQGGAVWPPPPQGEPEVPEGVLAVPGGTGVSTFAGGQSILLGSPTKEQLEKFNEQDLKDDNEVWLSGEEKKDVPDGDESTNPGNA